MAEINGARLRLWQFLYDMKRVEFADIPKEYRKHVVKREE